LRMAISLLSCPASCWHSAVRPIMIRPCDFRLRTIAMCSRYFFFCFCHLRFLNQIID
jgi:hypothetical protein